MSIEAQVPAIIEQAKAIVVNDLPSRAAAGEFLQQCKALTKQIKDHHDPVIAAALASHRAALAARDGLLKHVNEASAQVATLIKRFDVERERERLELQRREQEKRDAAERERVAAAEQARKQKEDAERIRAAEEMALLGATAEEAQQVAEEAVAELPAPVELPPLRPVEIERTKDWSGVTSRFEWRHEVVDADKVHRMLCSPDDKKIRAHIKNPEISRYLDMTGEDEIVIDGIRFYKDAILTRRAVG